MPQPLWLVAGTMVRAAFAGNVAGYELGRWAGPAVLDGRAPSRTARARRRFARYGPVAVVLARFVPVVRHADHRDAGAVGMPRRTYLLYSGGGAALWARRADHARLVGRAAPLVRRTCSRTSTW